ncbi:MAG: hypothetical protein NTX65_03410 [Ignavibacteriales bacterium]|nr:hypothetical protein [Ignavibacteriales bacterium]
METDKIFSTDSCLIAIILRNDFSKSGLSFITDSNHELQLAFIDNPAGHVVSKHYHPKYDRIISRTLECLIVKKGKVEVSFYDNHQEFIISHIITAGDLILFMDGGHSLKNIDRSELIEIRQGPYNQELDKIKF